MNIIKVNSIEYNENYNKIFFNKIFVNNDYINEIIINQDDKFFNNITNNSLIEIQINYNFKLSIKNILFKNEVIINTIIINEIDSNNKQFYIFFRIKNRDIEDVEIKKTIKSLLNNNITNIIELLLSDHEVKNNFKIFTLDEIIKCFPPFFSIKTRLNKFLNKNFIFFNNDLKKFELHNDIYCTLTTKFIIQNFKLFNDWFDIYKNILICDFIND
jgi:hypothetical protein